ncbi:EAL domain-containing protein [Vibrio sinaloensis]|nr:EAL domain-containing protein [Vibrio sinaloensis]
MIPPFLLTASIAATNTAKLQTEFDEMTWSLGVAMTEAKKSKNTVSFVNAQFQEQHLKRLNVEFKLKKSDKKTVRFFVVFQPQFRADGSLCGVEALARWIDEELGYIPPDLFVSVAEQSGLMSDLGELIMQKKPFAKPLTFTNQPQLATLCRSMYRFNS